MAKKRMTPEEDAWKFDEKKVKTSIRNALINKINEKLVCLKKVHSATIYTSSGSKVAPIKPKSERNSEIDFLRHLSTVLLCSNKNYIEVQAALSQEDKIIYISANQNEKKLPDNMPKINEIIQSFYVGIFEEESCLTLRQERHLDKLLVQTDKYSEYKIEIVNGTPGKHAEMKILDNDKNISALAGVRRPCLACSIRLNAAGLEADYNDHSGPFWATINALSPLVGDIYKDVEKKHKTKKIENDEGLIKTINETMTDVYDPAIKTQREKHIRYVDKKKKPTLDFDTDSEPEYEES